MIISKQDAIRIGLKKYFTGKPCKHGHISHRYIQSNSCMECINENVKKWSRNNNARCASNMRLWRKRNPERVKIIGDKSNVKWFSKPENRALAAYLSKTRYWAKREEILSYNKKFRDENKVLIKERQQRWYNKNKGYFLISARNRKARKRKNGGSHTASDIADIFRLQRGLCAYCKIKLTKKRHVDHIIPLIAGGRNDRKNLQLLCSPCNLSKGPKDPIVFSQERGLLL